jgi:hypothetical protein
MSGTLFSVVWFLGPVFIQKNWAGTCLFFLSSSNRNHGKTFAVLSKKPNGHNANIELAHNYM